MTPTIQGIVRGCHVVPDTPLPEGARVEVRVSDVPDLPPELAEEFAAWGRVSGRALELVERSAERRVVSSAIEVN